MNTSVFQSLLVGMLVVGALGASGPPATSGLFTDGHSHSAAFTAESAGSGSGGQYPKDALAYNDTQPENGQYDTIEDTYTLNQLNSLAEEGARLRFRSPNGNIGKNNDNIEVDVDAISADSPISFQSAAFSLRARNDVRLQSGTSISSKNNSPHIESVNGNVSASGLEIKKAWNVQIYAENGRIDLTDSINLVADGRIEIIADGDILINGTNQIDSNSLTIESRNGDIDVRGVSIVPEPTRLCAWNGEVRGAEEQC